LQKVLAQALHRIYNIPVTQKGSDLEDVKQFEKALDIEIQIYNSESRQIYRGVSKQVKVYLFRSDNHSG